MRSQLHICMVMQMTALLVLPMMLWSACPWQTLRNSGFDDMETLMDMQEEHMRELGMPSGHIVKLKRPTAMVPIGRFDLQLSFCKASYAGSIPQQASIQSTTYALTLCQWAAT